MKTIKLTALLLSFFLSPLAFAKAHMVAELGKLSCLDSKTSDKGVIDRVGVKLSRANRSEKKLVTRIIHTIVSLTNEQQATRLLSGLTINFRDIVKSPNSGRILPAHQLVKNNIFMARLFPIGGKNIDIPNKEGILIHEIGHFIANKRGFYPQYNSSVPKRKRCKLTTYMSENRSGTKHKNRKEEFAEVFASYLIYGKKLRRKCKRSFNFVKEKLFLDTNPNCI